MNEIMELITKYEEKSERTCVSVTIFSDGSGQVSEYGTELFSFDNEQQLKEWLQS